MNARYSSTWLVEAAMTFSQNGQRLTYPISHDSTLLSDPAARRSAWHHPHMSPCATVVRTLERYGLLLQQDKKALSVVGLITGEALSSSWWNHPRGSEIFACLRALGDRPDVMTTRLISGKVTFAHERLWPALLAVATSREGWQLDGLSASARALLRRVESTAAVEASGPDARDLQNRLLVRATEIHTESGRHAVALQPWRTMPSRIAAMDVKDARGELETAAAAIGAPPSTLPWNRRRKRAT
jgi:hypothetical protein